MTDAVDLFAGMGGMGLAAEQAGGTVVYSNEIDKHAADTHDFNFMVETDRRSITEVQADEVPAHDLLLAGFPCQAFSIAGKRGGFADARGNLFAEALRVGAAKRTPLLIFENVKGLVSHDKGDTLRTIMRHLAEAGYAADYRVLHSWKHAAIPQARERMFIVAALGAERIPDEAFPQVVENLPDAREAAPWRELLDPAETIAEKYWYAPESRMSEHFERHFGNTDRVYRYMGRTGVWGVHPNDAGLVPTMTASTGGGTHPMVLDQVFKFHRANELRESELVPTIMANAGTGGGKVPMILDDVAPDAYQPRRLTPREAIRMQGYPDTFQWPTTVSDTQRYKMIGNSVTVPLVRRLITTAMTALF